MTVPVPSRGQVKRVALVVVGIIVCLYAAYLVREIWLPLGLAFLVAMVLDPVVDRMESRGWSRRAAATFIFLSFVLIVGGLIVLCTPHIYSQFDSLQRGFEHRFPDQSHKGLVASFRRMGASAWLSSALVNVIESSMASMQHSSQLISAYGMSIAANAIWVVIVPIVAFYALRDFHVILAKGLLLVPKDRRSVVQTVVTEVTGVFARYLRGLAIVSAWNGVATVVLLSILRVPGATLIGIAAGVLYSVPYVGALLTIVITAAVAFIGGGPQLMLIAVGSSVVLHQVIFDQIISPRILGGHVGLHPILSIVALLSGQLLLGIAGMIIAVPVAACLQMAVLAIVPKLSQPVEISLSNGPDLQGSLESLEEDSKAAHERIDATEDFHAAVTAAVDSMEEQTLPTARNQALLDQA